MQKTDYIPEKIKLEITNLNLLDTAQLQQVAQSEMRLEDQQALEQWLDIQNVRILTHKERAQLEALRTEYGRVLLRKARAFAMLAKRGVCGNLLVVGPHKPDGAPRKRGDAQLSALELR